MTLVLPTEDQLALARGVADFLPGAPDWRELARQGVIGISLPEDQGGLGLSMVEEVLVARELGRALVSPALIGAMLGVHVAARAGETALRDALLSGETRTGLAVGVRDGSARVVDGDGLFLLVEGDRLSLVESELDPRSCIDDSLCLSAASLPGGVLASIDSPELALAGQLLAAGFLTAMLESARDMAAEHARTRVQFGRPIGAFQAIKHRCADAALGAELAWTMLWSAANALESGATDAAFQVGAAKWLAGDEALKAARFDIQAHGGMGFTQEVGAQRLLKRTHVLHQMFGDPRPVPAALARLPLEIG